MRMARLVDSGVFHAFFTNARNSCHQKRIFGIFIATLVTIRSSRSERRDYMEHGPVTIRCSHSETPWSMVRILSRAGNVRM